MIVNPQTNPDQQVERVRLEVEAGRTKICVERYEDRLGWYTAGSLSISEEQLAILAEALEGSRKRGGNGPGKVIPFPGRA